MIGKQIKYFRLQKQAKQEELAEYLGGIISGGFQVGDRRQ